MTKDELAAIYDAYAAFEKDAITTMATKLDELDALVGELMDSFPVGAKSSDAFAAIAAVRRLNQLNYALNGLVTKFEIARTAVMPVDITQQVI